MMTRTLLAIGVIAGLIGGSICAIAVAQRDEDYESLWRDLESNRRPPNDTEFIFARVRFQGSQGDFAGFGGKPGWAHDYPDAEKHILQVASEATGVNLHKESYVIVNLDSEEIFNYPFLYFSEVGGLDLTDRELANLREHLNRGGFAVVDDFEGARALDWFRYQMKKVFPEREFVEMKLEDPVFHTFYEIPTLDVEPAYGVDSPPKFYGYFDDRGRLCMIINHNNDMGDFWEWIDQPRFPLQPSTEALRLGINYFIYSLTH
ncbi:MAG TPA: DUF4159 domain-containing protein [Terriglobia bacterium]|jgi:hypothetical protein